MQDVVLLKGGSVYKQLGLNYYHISPLTDLEISGKPQKNVVGYDKNSVYTLADNKKKPLEGSTELKSNLALTKGDVCADFAAKVTYFEFFCRTGWKIAINIVVLAERWSCIQFVKLP